MPEQCRPAALPAALRLIASHSRDSDDALLKKGGCTLRRFFLVIPAIVSNGRELISSIDALCSGGEVPLSVASRFLRLWVKSGRFRLLDTRDRLAVIESASKMLATGDDDALAALFCIEKKNALFSKSPLRLQQHPRKIMNWGALTDAELATSISALSREVYRRIELQEVLRKGWTRPKYAHCGDTICAFIDQSNHISWWTAAKILSSDISSPSERKDLCARFARVGVLLLDSPHSNFHGAIAILSGLLHSSVRRLKLCGKDNADVVRLKAAFSPTGRYSEYREMLQSRLKVRAPCIPHLGVHLTDALAAHESFRRESEECSESSLKPALRKGDEAFLCGSLARLADVVQILEHAQQSLPCPSGPVRGVSALLLEWKAFSAASKKDVDAMLRKRSSSIVAAPSQ